MKKVLKHTMILSVLKALNLFLWIIIIKNHTRKLDNYIIKNMKILIKLMLLKWILKHMKLLYAVLRWFYLSRVIFSTTINTV